MNLESLTLNIGEIQAIQRALPTLSLKEKIELMDMLEEREKRYALVAGRTDIIKFALHVYPGFKVGPHHRKLAKIFQEVVDGKKGLQAENVTPVN